MEEKVNDVPGFSYKNNSEIIENEASITNKKLKKNSFQTMGLSLPVLNGILKRGYKIPTPIQRKTIPLILEGRDVVAMAKTGSGKTAAFLIPLFEKLKSRNATYGARALILSPTRELAIQTFKFFKELGKFLDLKASLILGGDSMDSQFSSIHSNPDIIIATPGRFLHLCVEMELKLGSINYVVFDEADRLFEQGFEKQLNEILNRLPDSSKQTVMFSATLPKSLVEFAKVGLSDPVLIRLDLESKIPNTLELKFIFCRPNERYTSLITLLKYVVPKESQTIVFAATQQHVELLSFILTEYGISNTLVYSNLDPSARKINVAKFTHKQVSVLIVTDVAARGIDIPTLDYVINVHFPGKPKLFVHRVGRCARAGRVGTAYSIFSTEDEAHLLDLLLFLNRDLSIKDNKLIGTIPQDIFEEEHQMILKLLKSHNIDNVYKTSENAYKKYISSRPVASEKSNKKVKSLKFYELNHLEDFLNLTKNMSKDRTNNKNEVDDDMKSLEERQKLILQMKNYKSSGTVFELNHNKKSIPSEIMKKKREFSSKAIEKFQKHKEDENKSDYLIGKNNDETLTDSSRHTKRKKRKNDLNEKKIKRQKSSFKDEEYFIPYESSNKYTEAGLEINSFQKQAESAELSIVDKKELTNIKPGMKKWDRVKKKMVAVKDPRKGKIKTESGMWISSSYKTGRYDEWKEKTKYEEQLQRENEDEEINGNNEKQFSIKNFGKHKFKGSNPKNKMNKFQQEIKNPDQIVKRRLRLEFVKKRELENKIKKAQNRRKAMKKKQSKKH